LALTVKQQEDFLRLQRAVLELTDDLKRIQAGILPLAGNGSPEHVLNNWYPSQREAIEDFRKELVYQSSTGLLALTEQVTIQKLIDMREQLAVDFELAKIARIGELGGPTEGFITSTEPPEPISPAIPILAGTIILAFGVIALFFVLK
jgi:hypothetical protein